MAMRVIQASVMAVGALATSAHSADQFSTDWAASAKSQARLVAAAENSAGFEIRLAPGAITYWRDPGDAGAPPTFDFSGSDNVAKVEPVFPAPPESPNPTAARPSAMKGASFGRCVSSAVIQRSPSRWLFTSITRCARESACRRKPASS